MPSPSYATICAVLSGIANLIVWTGYDAHVFIVESVLHSVNGRQPERMGPHDGYYGLAVSNVFFMLSTIAIPIMMNYMRCKLSTSVSLDILPSFPHAKLWKEIKLYLGSFSVMGAGIVNMIITKVNLEEGIENMYREYSDTEIRFLFGAFALLSFIGMIMFSFLPNQDVENNIASLSAKTSNLSQQLVSMLSTLIDRRVLILSPYYLYVGLFLSYWISILPTTLQFTKVDTENKLLLQIIFFLTLSSEVFLPSYFGFTFSTATIIMSVITMKLSSRVANFSLKPLMITNAVIHLFIYGLSVSIIPEWSTVRPNDEPSLFIQPSIFYILVIAFLCGLAEVANSTTRTVISSLLIPEKSQQGFGASRFYHALAASTLFFVSPSLSIYTYAAVLSSFMIVSTVVFIYTSNEIIEREKQDSK